MSPLRSSTILNIVLISSWISSGAAWPALLWWSTLSNKTVSWYHSWPRSSGDLVSSSFLVFHFGEPYPEVSSEVKEAQKVNFRWSRTSKSVFISPLYLKNCSLKVCNSRWENICLQNFESNSPKYFKLTSQMLVWFLIPWNLFWNQVGTEDWGSIHLTALFSARVPLPFPMLSAPQCRDFLYPLWRANQSPWDWEGQLFRGSEKEGI